MATQTADRTVSFATFIGRPLEEIASVLVANGPAVIAGSPRPDRERLVVELEVPIGQHSAVRRTAVVALGMPESDERTLRLPLRVSAVHKERWFPTFTGALEASEPGFGETRLRLVGTYELPMGPLGRASGHLGGDRSARASLYALFLEIAAGIERETRLAAPAWRPAPLPDSLRDEDRVIDA